VAKAYSRIIHFIFEACGGVWKKTIGQEFLEGWSIEGHITKVLEQIVIDFGLVLNNSGTEFIHLWFTDSS